MTIFRRVLSCLAAALLVLAAAQLVLGTPADAASAPAGTYVPLATQSRVVDTRTGAGGNRKGALTAGRTISVKIAGVGRVPATGVGSVVATVTASQPTGTGALVVYGATRPHTTNLRFAAGQTPVTNTAVVPLSSGRVHIANTATRGSVQVAVDVSGYYRSGTPSGTDPGIFHALGTARRVATLKPHGGSSVQVAIGGHAGVPTGAGAAAVTLTVTGATRSGTVLGHRPDEPRLDLPLVRFAAGQAVSSFAVLRLSGGRATLVNTSSRTVQVTVDVAGWYTIGFAQTAQAFQTVIQTRVLSTHLGAGAGTAVTVAGKGGVPRRNVAAALVTLHALSPGATGGLQAWRAGVTRPRSTTVLQFKAGRSASNVVLVPVSASGRIALHNTSRARTGLAVDVDGYVPANMLTPPAASKGRYLSDLTGVLADDTATMQTHGCADATAGSRFVLLDLGAQTITAPLGAGDPGVALAKTNPTVRYDYADLQTLVGAYLTSFASCSAGRSAEVALSTNNSGVWQSGVANYYAPWRRGADWGTFVADVAATPQAGITVAGAGDFEPTSNDFPGTEKQVETWKTNYLAKTSAEFVFNGSADGCPVTWTKNGTCNSGWTARQLYGLSSGSRTRALPQIYHGFMATQWAMIDATGGGCIRFVGALQQPTVSNVLSTGQSWVALTRAVAAVTTTAVPRTVVTLLG